MAVMEDGPRGSRTDEVHGYLLAAIERGEFVVGSRLPAETSLAAQLGVSRPVVREAVSRLAAAGLVRSERGRGTFVAAPPSTRHLTLSPIEGVDDLIAWQELRIAVEQETARLAAERRSAEDLGALEDIHCQLIHKEQAGTRGIDLDFEFHLAIAAATRNPVLVEAQRSLGDHIRGWMATMLQTTSRSPTEHHAFRHREHQAILDAVRRMDPDAASQAARRHIENGRIRMLTELSAGRHTIGRT